MVIKTTDGDRTEHCRSRIHRFIAIIKRGYMLNAIGQGDQVKENPLAWKSTDSREVQRFRGQHRCPRVGKGTQDETKNQTHQYQVSSLSSPCATRHHHSATCEYRRANSGHLHQTTTISSLHQASTVNYGMVTNDERECGIRVVHLAS